MRGTGGDSFCKTATPRRENVTSRVAVPIMSRAANKTGPYSHSKTLPALRAGAAVTHAAGLGGKRFVDLLEPHSCVIAFVPKHGSQRAPAGIENGLTVSAPGQPGGVDVSNEDGSVAALHEANAALVQEVLPPMGNLGVERPHPILLSGPLGALERRLEIAVEARRLDVLHRLVRESSESFEPEVDAERSLDR